MSEVAYLVCWHRDKQVDVAGYIVRVVFCMLLLSGQVRRMEIRTNPTVAEPLRSWRACCKWSIDAGRREVPPEATGCAD